MAETPDRDLRTAAMRRLRLEKGLSLREAGALIGRDASAVSRYENGLRKPPPALRIAKIFGVTQEQMLLPCPRRAYAPPPGYACLRCGSRNEEETMADQVPGPPAPGSRDARLDDGWAVWEGGPDHIRGIWRSCGFRLQGLIQACLTGLAAGSARSGSRGPWSSPTWPSTRRGQCRGMT